jgi:hypothetical protein
MPLLIFVHPVNRQAIKKPVEFMQPQNVQPGLRQGSNNLAYRVLLVF